MERVRERVRERLRDTRGRRRGDPLYSLQFIQRDFTADDYEMLLSLDENKINTKGATPLQIQSLLSITYSKDLQIVSDSCVVCLDAFIVEQQIKKLQCNHAYHSECIDKWLEKSRFCPVCNQEVLFEVDKEAGAIVKENKFEDQVSDTPHKQHRSQNTKERFLPRYARNNTTSLQPPSIPKKERTDEWGSVLAKPKLSASATLPPRPAPKPAPKLRETLTIPKPRSIPAPTPKSLPTPALAPKPTWIPKPRPTPTVTIIQKPPPTQPQPPKPKPSLVMMQDSDSDSDNDNEASSENL
uniref:RING-type domain-containing protein n=1 Tax=Arcella intermedia TaxID=1963864 RepID=A0A6B2LBF7_9EUKA